MHDSASNVQPRTREVEYLGEVEFVSSNQDVASVLSGFNKINEKFGQHNVIMANENNVNSGNYYQHNFGDGKPCSMPTRVEDALLYR